MKINYLLIPFLEVNIESLVIKKLKKRFNQKLEIFFLSWFYDAESKNNKSEKKLCKISSVNLRWSQSYKKNLILKNVLIKTKWKEELKFGLH